MLRGLAACATAALVSMALYRATSNQQHLAAIKAEMAALRGRIAVFDGPFSEDRKSVV